MRKTENVFPKKIFHVEILFIMSLRVLFSVIDWYGEINIYRDRSERLYYSLNQRLNGLLDNDLD